MKDFTEKCTACNGRGGSEGSGVCHDCYGQGEIPDHAAKLDAYDKREALVQEVIAKYKALTELALAGQYNCENADAALFDALAKLAGWKP